jgi:hypothetical protein
LLFQPVDDAHQILGGMKVEKGLNLSLHLTPYTVYLILFPLTVEAFQKVLFWYAILLLSQASRPKNENGYTVTLLYPLVSGNYVSRSKIVSAFLSSYIICFSFSPSTPQNSSPFFAFACPKGVPVTCLSNGPSCGLVGFTPCG